MSTSSPLWHASLDHLQINSPNPLALAEWYRDVMGMTPERLSDELYLVQAPQRRLLIGRGQKSELPFNAWTLQRDAQLRALREHAEMVGVPVEKSPTPLFGSDAFAVRDPDGRLAVFGLPAKNVAGPPGSVGKASGFPARLQHSVVATTQLDAMLEFYERKLGFIVSDTVFTNQEHEPLGDPHVQFFRADNEHHSLAVFTGSSSRYDHHCYETTSWNDIRDWLDYLGELDIAPWWGPGRHGPGNNLFFMIKDLDGNNIELSAELERFTRVSPPRNWPNSRRMYNLWGVSWIRE